MGKLACIYCGARKGNSEDIISMTKALCSMLIADGYDLLYGGGSTGIMGLIADEFLSSGRKVIGIRPERLISDEDMHQGITEMIVVSSMNERKAQLVEMGDLFIALPGGFGTLDEIIETVTLQKIGYIDKPCGILNVNGYYKGLEALLDRMVKEEFLKEYDRDRLIIASSPESLLNQMKV